MSKMIQIRHVPDKIHRTLKARAAEAGMSLSDFLLREITKVAEIPTRAELLERLRRLPRVPTSTSSADLIREGREERDDQLSRASRRR